MNLNLSDLISPLGLDRFRAKFVANEPCFNPSVSEKCLTALDQFPFLDSLESLLEHWTESIQVHLPDLRDEASSLDTDSQHALSFYDQGMALLFNNADVLSPALANWLQNIRNDLGLSALTYGRNLIYATPDGKGTAPHFDQNINLVLQIKGTKRWKVAPNHQVVNPMTRFTMGQAVDPEMMLYLERPMPQVMPQDALDFELRPGSLLFVPRGCWHSTEAHGDALALNFTFTAPTWLDLFTEALRSKLIMSPEWRETADLSATKFDELLSDLVTDMSSLTARDILQASEGHKK